MCTPSATMQSGIRMAVAVRLRCNRTASRFLVCDRSIASRLRLSRCDVALLIWVRFGTDACFGFLWLASQVGFVWYFADWVRIGRPFAACLSPAAAQHGASRVMAGVRFGFAPRAICGLDSLWLAFKLGSFGVFQNWVRPSPRPEHSDF